MHHCAMWCCAGHGLLQPGSSCASPWHTLACSNLTLQQQQASAQACLTAVVLSISHRARPVVQVRLHGRSGLQSRVYNLQVGEDMFPGLVRDNGSVQVPLLAHAVRL